MKRQKYDVGQTQWQQLTETCSAHALGLERQHHFPDEDAAQWRCDDFRRSLHARAQPAQRARRNVEWVQHLHRWQLRDDRMLLEHTVADAHKSVWPNIQDKDDED